MTVIELPDDQAAALKTKAAAQGLTLEAWFEKLSGVAVPTSVCEPGESAKSAAHKPSAFVELKLVETVLPSRVRFSDDAPGAAPVA